MSDDGPVEIEVRQGVMRPGWYWWAAMLASSLVVGVVAVVIALHVNAESDRKAELARRESERKWCSIVITLDSAYRQQPPQTPTGQELAESIAGLRSSLHCPPA